MILMMLLSVIELYAQADNQVSSGKIVYISDTQAPMWIESVFLKDDNNINATRNLLNDIPKQDPLVVNFLGDLVCKSCNNKKWSLIDSCLDKLHAAGYPTHACLGNHELMSKKVKGEKNFQARFPDHVNTGYSVIVDSIATVFLNSNFSKLSKEQKLKQDEWYVKTLAALDTAIGIKAVIVCCHHPPWSDSKMVGSSQEVQEHFVPAFFRSQKCKLFITGHAHMFQHFKVEGKDFLVIGGGGGLKHPLNKKSCGQKDLAADYKPMFHYLTVSIFQDHLKIISHKLNNEFNGTEEGMMFDVKLNFPH